MPRSPSASCPIPRRVRAIPTARPHFPPLCHTRTPFPPSLPTSSLPTATSPKFSHMPRFFTSTHAAEQPTPPTHPPEKSTSTPPDFTPGSTQSTKLRPSWPSMPSLRFRSRTRSDDFPKPSPAPLISSASFYLVSYRDVAIRWPALTPHHPIDRKSVSATNSTKCPRPAATGEC